VSSVPLSYLDYGLLSYKHVGPGQRG
jgi:hypothetical protein